MSGAETNVTGTIPPTDPTTAKPWRFQVENPSRRDVENASNKSSYHRVFANGYMTAYLEYTKRYDPDGRHFDYTNSSRWPLPRSAKTRNPVHIHAENAFEKWWAALPSTPAERAWMITVLRDVRAAVEMRDIPCAIELLKDVSLAHHIERDLIAALEESMYPREWDFMNPETRPPMPYTFPEDRQTNTSLTVSSTPASVTIT